MKLNLTTSPIKQPEGTTRYGLNVVTDLEHQGSDSNELGNIECVNLPSEVNGIITISRNLFVVFCLDNSIQLVDTSTCTVTQLIQHNDFNFDTNYLITGTARVVRGCENIIYWHDHLNSDRFYNIDRPEKFLTGGTFDITKTEFNPNVVHPTITTTILDNGGKLEYGTYNFALEFLTSNEDSIFVSPIDINYTPILYKGQEGALNISTNLPEVGGKPLSNKSIKLTISNIPEDAVLARVVVFRNITNGLATDAHVVGDLLTVSGTTLEYVYRGFNVDNGDYLTDKNAYLVPKAIYQSSLNGIQVNNRLVRYNLKESITDYSTYQSYASKICSKYVVSEVSKSDKNVHLLNQTLLGGEIILPAIVYVHNDGTVSNAYPQIGRAKLTSDAIDIDNPFSIGSTLERWQLEDTSIKDSTPISGYVSSGEFGYYESSQLYTNPPNFCGQDYWGKDCDDNDLEGLPVRLFVVPTRSVEKHEEGNNIRPIGIWFDEASIEYPNSDIVSHYFTLTIVNQSNVVNKGVAINTFLLYDEDNPTYKNMTGFYNYSSDLTLKVEPDYNFLSPMILDNGLANGTYSVNEGDWDFLFDQGDESFDNIFDNDLPYDDLDIFLNITNANFYQTNTQEFKLINNNLLIGPRTVVEDITNYSLSNTFNYLRLSSNFSGGTRMKYLSIKNFLNPIPNIWSIRTRRITELGETVSFKGNDFIVPLQIDNIADLNIYKNGVLDTIIFNDTTVSAQVEAMINFYVESKYNFYLRHLGTDKCNKTIQQSNNIYNVFLNKIVEPFKDELKVRDSICPFFLGYNQDYSYIQELNKYNSLSLTFDFCSECTGLYPHRLIFSPQSFAEDLADGYRINRANDYVDIPSNTGAIICVDYKDNKLVVRTERSCYFLQPNPQQMETSESNVYIGTGDFLSIPPQELNITLVGYGGQQHKLDSINTEKGLVWADKQRGEIYMLGPSFQELSQSMPKWFRDNLTAPHLVFGYDSLNDRLLMSNPNWTLSYCFKEEGWKSWHSYIPMWYFNDAATFYSILDKGVWQHNRGLYCNFYDIQFEHTIELILNQGMTFIPQSIIYHANVYDTINGYDKDVLGITYDKMLAYNDTQSTGIQELVLNQESFYYDNTTTHVKQVDRNYKISSLKDLASSPTIWNNDISSIKIGTQNWADKLPIVDITKPMVEQGDFRSKYLCVRLYFNNPNYKITLEFENSNKLISIR